MVFSAAIRRAISSSAPLAVRAIARRAANEAAFAGPLLHGIGVPRELRRAAVRALSSQRLSFSTSTSDGNLLRVIESEIECALESVDADEVNDDIPTKFPFEINDVPGQETVTLTRDFHGEKVQVLVYMPDTDVQDEEVGDKSDGDDEDGQSSQSSTSLVVTVSKGDGPSLQFFCTAYADEITIDSLSMKEVDKSDEDLAYEGPEFSDLDENLQKAFHKYLEIRGITAATTNFLHGYMLEKDNREYVTWLKNLKEFISK